MRVLVVEDEEGLRSYLRPLLEREGFVVDAVGTGGDALQIVRDRRPDLVLLDICLPDISGLDVCRQIRREPNYLPVILLTGLDAKADELAGFEAKADDYVTKPLTADTLLARIHAVLRLAAQGDKRVVRLGSVEVDLRLREARRVGVPLALTPREFDLLAFLVEHPGQVFGKTQLLSQVWGTEFEGDPHTVAARMSRLRAVIEDQPNYPRYLLSRRGVGYYVRLDTDPGRQARECPA